jgi:hypothetical protein
MFDITRLRKQVVPDTTGHLIWTGTLVACLLTIALVGCAQATPNAKACETLDREANVKNSASVAVAGSLDSVLASKGITSELEQLATDYWKAGEDWEAARQNIVLDGYGDYDNLGTNLNSTGAISQAIDKRKLAANSIKYVCSVAGVNVTGTLLQAANSYKSLFDKG